MRDREDTSKPAPVPPRALDAFSSKRHRIVQRVVERSLARTEEVAHHGDDAERLITAGIEFTTKMLLAAMEMNEPSLLEHQLEWAKDRLPHDGVEPKYLLNRLSIYGEVVEQLLEPAHVEQIGAYVEWLIERGNAIMDLELDPDAESSIR